MNVGFKRAFLLLCFQLVFIIFTTAQTEQRWWGYCSADNSLAGFGTGQIEEFNCAIFIEGNRGVGMGKSFDKIRLALQGVSSLSNVNVWVSTSLPESFSDANVFTSGIDATQLKDSDYFEVSLPKSYIIPRNGVYVGYSFSINSGSTGIAKKPVLVSSGVETKENSFYLKTSKTYKSWKDLKQYNKGNLAIQVYLNGEFIDNGASVTSFAEAVLVKGEIASIPVTIRNRGINGINSIDYTLLSENDVIEEKHVDFQTPISIVGDETQISFQFPASDKAEINHKTFIINKVNGVANEITGLQAQATGGIVTIEESAKHNVAMEEGTGCWCMWCPRGAVGITELKKDFPGRFVGISIHSGDVMSIEGYDNILGQLSGLPNCTLDREYTCDPFTGTNGGSYGIKSDVENLLDKRCEASVEVDGEWLDVDSTKIRLTSKVTLQYSRDDNPPYGICYVLIANDLHSEESTWIQNNGYASNLLQDYSQDSYLSFLTELPSHIEDYHYNDVAIAVYGADYGVDGSVVGPFVMGQPNNSTFDIDITDNRLVQDKKNIKVATLLIDRNSGRVINCDETEIAGVSVEGLQNVNAPSGVTRYYTLDGKVCGKGYKGLCIERNDDGSVRKIIK